MAEGSPGAMPRTRLGIVGLATFIGSAFIGFNTLVTSCASEHVTRDAAQLHTIEEKERFWTEAMQELSDVVKDKQKPDANFDARCRLLARRTAPFASAVIRAGDPSDPDTAPSPEIAELSERVGKLQDEFAKQIRDAAIVGSRCSGEFDLRKQTVIAEKDALNAIVGEVAKAAKGDSVVPYEAIAARQDLITLSGLSAKGIDVDVYWCDSTAEAEANGNYQNAVLLGQRLAGYASEGHKLTFGGQSDAVGQVRVRMLPRALLSPGGGYSAALGRNVLRGERRVQPFLRAIAQDASASGNPALAGWVIAPLRAKERNWYVAAAVCSASKPLEAGDADVDTGDAT